MQGVFLRNVQKTDPYRTQSLCPGAGALVHLAVAVFDVAQHRLAQIGQMGTDLVGAAGDKADLAQSKRPGSAQDIHVRDDLLAVRVLRLMRVDADLIVLFVMFPPGGETPTLRDAYRDGVVFLPEQVGADDLVHIAQGGIAFGCDHKTFGAAVQPVADAGLEAVLAVGVVFTFLGKILGKGIHQIGIAGAVAVAQKMGGLVQHGDVDILIDDGHFGLILLLFRGCFRGRLCAFRREKTRR